MLIHECLGCIIRAERGIEMKIESVEVAGLSVAEAGVLICVMESELDLQAVAVYVHDA